MSDREIRDRFSAAGVRFFHAMNLRGSSSYCERRAVLSRAELLAQDPGYTRFWSDEEDTRRNLMGRVFGNVYDFGAIYARSYVDASPNIYGPITFVFGPDVFEEMRDIVLTRRSIAMLVGPLAAHGIPDAELPSMLAGDGFGLPIAREYTWVELSCGNPEISFASLVRIIVEPLQIGNVALIDEVRRRIHEAGVDVPVEARAYAAGSDHQAHLQELCTSLWQLQHEDERPTRIELNRLPDWVAAMAEPHPGRIQTWATYFYNDTICFLREQAQEEEYEPPDYECICGALKDSVDYECEDCGHTGSNTDPPDVVQDNDEGYRVPFYSDARGDLEPLVCDHCGSGRLSLSYGDRCSRCEHRLASDD